MTPASREGYSSASGGWAIARHINNPRFHWGPVNLGGNLSIGLEGTLGRAYPWASLPLGERVGVPLGERVHHWTKISGRVRGAASAGPMENSLTQGCIPLARSPRNRSPRGTPPPRGTFTHSLAQGYAHSLAHGYARPRVPLSIESGAALSLWQKTEIQRIDTA